MTISVYTEAFFISTYILLLISGVTSLALLLVLRRRQNFPFYYNPTLGLAVKAASPEANKVRAIRYIHPTMLAEPDPIHASQNTMPETIYHVNIIPKEWRLPVQAGTADQLVIHIEPDGSLTDEQRNIQRIIQYLKQTPEQPTV